MDVFYAIFQTLGASLALGVLAVIPALFLASLFGLIPWPISAVSMAVVAGLVAYPSGIMQGSGKERARWEIKIYNMRSAIAVKKHQAELAVLVIEEKYLKGEREKSQRRRTRDAALVNLMRNLPTQTESKTDETSLCPATPVCNPYNMLAWPSVLRNIRKR